MLSKSVIVQLKQRRKMWRKKIYRPNKCYRNILLSFNSIKTLFVPLSLFFSTSILSQTIVKTNAFNILLIPSIHLEQGLSHKHSLQLNLHRGSFTFFSKRDWFNASLDYRYYPANYKDRALSGFYLSPGIHYNYEYNEPIIGENQEIISYGRPNLGVVGRIGYQTVFKNMRWSLDLGIGLAAYLIYLKKAQNSNAEAEFRMMAGIGYRI